MAATVMSAASSSHPNLHRASHTLIQAFRVTGKNVKRGAIEVKRGTKVVLQHAKKGIQQGADVVMVTQNIQQCQHQFGIDLYDLLAPQVDDDPILMILPPQPQGGSSSTDEIQTQNPSSSSTTPPWPLEEIQGPFVSAYKNIKALTQKQYDEEQMLKELDEQRRRLQSRHGCTLDFDVPANSPGERIINAPQFAKMKAAETRTKGNIVSIQQQIIHEKHILGITCYQQFFKLQLTTGWLPQHDEIRNRYLTIRDTMIELEKLLEKKKQQQGEEE